MPTYRHAAAAADDKPMMPTLFKSRCRKDIRGKIEKTMERRQVASTQIGWESRHGPLMALTTLPPFLVRAAAALPVADLVVLDMDRWRPKARSRSGLAHIERSMTTSDEFLLWIPSAAAATSFHPDRRTHYIRPKLAICPPQLPAHTSILYYVLFYSIFYMWHRARAAEDQ